MLRVPFFVVALVAIALVVCVELGQTLLLGGQNVAAAFTAQATDVGVQIPGGANPEQPSGVGVPYLALIDFMLLFTMLLMGASLVMPHRLHGRLQGVITLIVAFLLIFVAIGMALLALAELILMVTLLLAFPFGTIAYLIGWGSFPRGDATVLLSLIMTLKLVFAGALLLAQQRFAQNKGLVLLTLTSLVCTIVVATLHGMVPGIFVSITDAVAGIIVAIVAVIWAIVLLIGSIPGIVNAVRATAAAPAASVAAKAQSVATA